MDLANENIQRLELENENATKARDYYSGIDSQKKDMVVEDLSGGFVIYSRCRVNMVDTDNSCTVGDGFDHTA